MDVFSGNRSKLLEILRKVFDYRESKEDLLLKKMGHATIAVLQAPTTFNFANGHWDKKKKPLQRDQSMYCKKIGHWKINVHTGNRYPPPPNLRQI